MADKSKKQSEQAASESWNYNNIACRNTYGALYLQRQILDGVSFDDAEKLKMPDLLYWNETAVSEEREFRAEIVFKRMDDLFRKYLLAGFEDAKETFASAKDKISKTLLDKSKSVPDLAVDVDNVYSFHGESK